MKICFKMESFLVSFSSEKLYDDYDCSVRANSYVHFSYVLW